MRRFAIFISTETYENFSDTPHCHGDSALLHQVLTTKCDYPEENTLVIKLDVSNSLSSIEILNQVQELLARSNDGDSILFYYAGHGESINGSSYLILPTTQSLDREATALKLSDLIYYMSGNKRLNIRIFDTCHSGENIRANDTLVNSEGFMSQLLEAVRDLIVNKRNIA